MADKENKVDQEKVKADAEKLAGGKSTGPENVPAATPAQPAQRATPADPVTGQPAQRATPAQPAQPAHLSEGDATDKTEDKVLKKHGPGYIRAVKGGQQTTFSQRAWDLLGDNKEGWKAETKKPREVQDLEAKKAASDTGK